MIKYWARYAIMGLNILSIVEPSHAKVVNYTLTISEQKLNISGKERVGLAINNSIPGPTIKAKIGDILYIEVKNNLDTETSIHWHGVLVPNRMDGVPYITTPPIKARQVFVYEFPIKQSGTYWYHAHTGLQEQQGIYGAIIFSPEHDTKNYDEEHVVVLSDWTDENPEQVLANIKKDSDYYALKKDSVQSWFKILSNGDDAIKIRLNNALRKMWPMDISDIGYDAFLINGKCSVNLSHAKPGTRVKLRIINAAASSYFILEYSGGPMEIIESDGIKVQPLMAQRIKIAMAETYDVIVTVPSNKTYEFRASSEDGTGFATARIGIGPLVPAPLFPKPNLVLMSMHGMDHGLMEGMHEEQHDLHNMHHMDQTHDDKTMPYVDFLNNYKKVKSLAITSLPQNNPQRIINLRLTGSMERYVWTINDTPMYATDKILIQKGENVKFVLVNETMMHHPIHIHGHFFRVLNGQGDYSPLKHTVNVAPFETVEIEFEANAEKDWIFHCHNLYHMKLGMGGIIHYKGTQTSHDVTNHKDDHSAEHGNIWFNSTNIAAFSNVALTQTKFMRNNDFFILDARHNYKKDYEAEIIYQKYVSQYLGLYIGGDFKREGCEKLNRAIIGFEYTLPLFIKADLRFNTNGQLRFGLANEHQITDRVSFSWKWNTDREYTLIINYAITKQLYIIGNYDSRENFGIGLGLKF